VDIVKYELVSELALLLLARSVRLKAQLGAA